MSEEQPSVVTLMSGGLDSSLMAVMLRDNGWRVIPVFVNYGQLALEYEWKACVHIHKKFDLPKPLRVNVPDFGKKLSSGLVHAELHVVRDAHLPGRNMLFLLTAAAIGAERGAEAIAIGLLNEDNRIFSDQSSAFLSAAADCLKFSVGQSIKVIAPLIAFNKADVVALAKARGIDRTYSCHAGKERPCGKCISCNEFKFRRA